jgi:hypothetical protein
MTPQERQIIESLFQRLARGAAQAGPRDPEAEALIQQRLQGFPGGPYYLAQTLIVQEQALQQAEARQRQQGSFLPGGGQPAQAPGYPPPSYAAPPARGGGAGGFLAGAGQMALGIGGGILVAEAATSLAQGLFGHHDPPGGGYDDGRPFEGYSDDQQDGGDAYADPGDSGDSGGFDDSGGSDW